jgi:cell wall biosynthesis protein
VLTNKGFEAGNVGNNDAGHVTASQVQAAKADDLGAQAISKELGGIPVVENASVPSGSARVVLAGDYTGPGSGLDGSDPTLDTVDPAAAGTTDSTEPPPSPILTAGSNDPECVN